ncbi:N-acetylmuramic acid 6-phosphate etherase [Brevibacterium sp. p3-SID960]|uniref:N-acetylmuramic acid 6-phosphate etherase n=1 Tax=Brevibacterium sp. p3-SID960 TaxID=2916063 RepID=UPI0021A5CBF6|nr:N-acetylmuramic acid 6-phosphate etherase [Brevibacterium sp. p3-SID960]MCT1691873.1 N-acetylmuramic acid 6-phosphate etherase [Brevibacterium sp. p3-SID960]
MIDNTTPAPTAGLLSTSAAGAAAASAAGSTPSSTIASTTEAIDSRFAHIDTLSTIELAGVMNNEDARVAPSVGAHLAEIARAVDGITERMRRGGRLIYVGAGTAGRLGVLDASECPPTFSTDPSRVIGLIAGGRDALITAVEGAEDDTALGRADIAAQAVGPDDAVVGIAASGATPYTVDAVTAAREAGAFTAGISCNADSALGAAAEVPIEVVVGPELVAGSTRLKAGTAQKLVLNMLSTMTMIRLGKTYGNLMVDVDATNHKLTARVHRIVTEATGADEDTVTSAVEAAGGKAKTAILMILADLDALAAEDALAAAGGVLRTALTTHTPNSQKEQS